MNRLEKIHENLSVFHAIQFPLLIIDKDFNVIFANQAAEGRLANFKESTNIERFFPEIKNTNFHLEAKLALLLDEQRQTDIFLSSLNEWFQITFSPFTNSLIVYWQDISHQKTEQIKNHQQRLKPDLADRSPDWEEAETEEQNLPEKQNKKTTETLKLLSSSLAYADDAILITEAENIDEPGPEILYVNNAFTKMTGYSSEEVIGKSPRILQGPRTDRGTLSKIKSALQKHEPVLVEIINYRKDGSEFWVEINMAPVFNEQGKCTHMVGIQRETSDRAQMIYDQISKEERELYYRHIAESIPQIVWTADYNGLFDYYNKRWYEYTGLTHDQSKGLGWKIAVQPDQVQRVSEKWNEAVKSGENYEDEFLLRSSADETYRWHLSRALPVKDNNGSIIKWLGTLTDIDEQKRVEQGLRISETKFKRFFQGNLIGACLTNEQGIIIEANESFLKIIDYKRDELQKAAINWRDLTPPQQRETDEKIEEILAKNGFIEPIEKEYLQKNGKLIPVLVGASLLEERTADGGIVFYVLDISERKEAEKRKDEFISMASHELKTPVASIKILTQLLKTIFEKKEEKESLFFLEKVDQQIDNLTNLISDLLNISKIQTSKLEFNYELFDISELILKIVETYKFSNKKHKIIVNNNFSKKLISADKERMSQVFVNLIANAIKYSPLSEKIIITLSENANNLQISIQDFGIGIEEKHLEKIFDRFYRVMDDYEKTFPGLGIGLYISAEIIKHHKGKIWVESKKGEGSIFSFTLPISSEKYE